jgi:hypothetical protein
MYLAGVAVRIHRIQTFEIKKQIINYRKQIMFKTTMMFNKDAILFYTSKPSYSYSLVLSVVYVYLRIEF